MYILKDTQRRSTCTLSDSKLQNFNDEAQTKIGNKITCFNLHNYLMAPNSTFPNLMFDNENDVSLITANLAALTVTYNKQWGTKLASHKGLCSMYLVSQSVSQLISLLRHEVILAVRLKIKVFRDVMQCSFTDRYQY